MKPTQCECLSLLFCKVLALAWRRYWHWQLYSIFYRPYCCLSGHLLLWFIETENSPGQTVEHEIQFVLRCGAPTCKIVWSACLYITVRPRAHPVSNCSLSCVRSIFENDLKKNLVDSFRHILAHALKIPFINDKKHCKSNLTFTETLII